MNKMDTFIGILDFRWEKNIFLAQCYSEEISYHFKILPVTIASQ